MAAYKLTDFNDIYTAITEELKLQSSDTTSLNRIKRAINMIYLDEVVPRTRWYWLYGHTKVRHALYYASGTCSVTPNSTTVTLSVAPTSTVGESGSFVGYNFSLDSKSEIYTISAHTALSTTITLSTAYNDDLNATASYKIWKSDLALPTDLRETIEVTHDHMSQPMEGKGIQELRKLATESPKTESRPYYYCTHDYNDDTAEEDTRYRLLRVYPAISQYTTILNVDYMKEATALDVAGDEPLMPVEDRIVLYYGALSILWSSIGRNPEEAARNKALFDDKLARMLGKIQDSMDKPRVEPESTYVVAKRGPRIAGLSRRGLNNFSGGQSTYNAPKYLEDVTINGATITGNVAVNNDITIDGRDLSDDGTALDAHIAASVNVHGIGATASVVGTDTTQTLTNKSINADANIITNIDNADIKAAAAIARTKLASGTASRVVTNDGSGVMQDDAITTTELSFLDDVTALSTVVLTDNTSSPTAAITAAHASFNVIKMEYSISRGSAIIESGIINIVTDGSTASIAQGAVAGIGSTGVVFTVDVSGSNVRLLYTTTSTGTNASLKYKAHKWLA